MRQDASFRSTVPGQERVIETPIETGVMAAARHECERRVEAGEPLTVVERFIDGVPVSPDARASLWLLAWSLREARTA